MKSNNLDNFVAEMLKLDWKLDAIYPDNESRDGSSVLGMLYESDTCSIWSMFTIFDSDLDNYQVDVSAGVFYKDYNDICLLYTSPSPRDATLTRMPSSA